MTAQLKGKRALVTGGNKGIRFAISPQMWFHDHQETSY